MRVTQQDIARIANVSQATVSRVLGGDERVESEIRDRVVRVMQEHNYRPDVRARSLRNQRTHLIGLVMRREPKDLQGDPFFSLFVSEILGVLASTPYHLCVDLAASATHQDHVYDEMLRTRRVDGLILVESEPRDERVMRLQSDDFPFVLIGNPNDVDLYSIDNDNVFAGRLATKHLLEQGYRRIAFLAGPEHLTVSRDRLTGYRQVVCEAGSEPTVAYSEFGFGAARDSALALLSRNDRPDALVVLDDYMAMGAIQAARELRLSIPEQLGLASFNDTALCRLVAGGLTSVSLNIPELVRRACSMLLDIVEGKEKGGPRRTIIPCEIKVRGSSGRTPEVSLA